MTKSMFANLEEMYQAPIKAEEEDGIKITIMSSPCQLNLRFQKELENSDSARQFIDRINKGQSLARYQLAEGCLVLDTTMLVEKRPTYNGIKLLCDQYLSQFRSIMLLLGGLSNEQ